MTDKVQEGVSACGKTSFFFKKKIYSVLLKGDRRSLKKHCLLMKQRKCLFPFQTCDVFLGRDVHEFTGRVLGMLEHPLHLTGGRRRENESIFFSCCDNNCFYMPLQVLAKKNPNLFTPFKHWTIDSGYSVALPNFYSYFMACFHFYGHQRTARKWERWCHIAKGPFWSQTKAAVIRTDYMWCIQCQMSY